MPDRSTPPIDPAEGDVDPAEAFALLADETRFDLLRLHPAVVAFYHERGVDVLGSRFREAGVAIADRAAASSARSPTRTHSI